MVLQGKLYRIMTEDKNRQGIIDTVSAYFDGFSMHEQTGYWRGIAEKSLCIDIITTNQTDIMRVSSIIQQLNHQESVLVETINNNAELVGM
jgi:hypothetical protein